MKVLMFQQPGFDYMSSQLTEGLYHYACNGKIELRTNQANTHHGAKVDGLKPVTIEEALDSLGWADLIIFSSAGNAGTFGPAEQIVLADPAYRHKRVYADGTDHNGLQVNPETVLLYFKREMRFPHCNYLRYSNVRSLTFGSYQFWCDTWNDDTSLEDQWDKRDIDVSFVAYGGSNKLRKECADILVQLHGQKGTRVYCNVDDSGQPLPKEAYDNVLRRSKVAISIPGAGIDTLRFWEIPAAGAVLCSFDITRLLMTRNPYEAWRHCLYFGEWRDMAELFALVVFNRTAWVQMRKAADEHRVLHTTTHRAQELLTMCEEVIDG